MKKNKIVSIIFLGLLTITIASCSSTKVSELPQEEGISIIKKDFQNKNWQDVINNVDEYRTRYPYSKFTVEADLLQANAYYLSDKFPEAILAYETFMKKNPTHAEISLVMYRIARCYDLQAPEAEDREQVNTEKAIAKYQALLTAFPNSEAAAEVNNRKLELTRRLADSEAFVANFYWKKDRYASALSRYQKILVQYNQFKDLRKIAIERAIVCYEKLADYLEKNPDSDKYEIFKNAKSDDLRNKAVELKKLL